MQPPWSTATSTMTLPGFMVASMSRVTSCGARAPGTSTAADHQVGLGDRFGDRARVARDRLQPSAEDVVEVDERCVADVQHPHARAEPDRHAGRVDADHAAAEDRPRRPPRRRDAAQQQPRPPRKRLRWCAPTCVAIRPATSLIGVRSGSPPLSSCTVSYATAVVPAARSASVSGRSAARCKKVNSTRSSRRKPYSVGVGSLTFSTIGAAQASPAVSTISRRRRGRPRRRSRSRHRRLLTSTSWPAATSDWTAAGGADTRYSCLGLFGDADPHACAPVAGPLLREHLAARVVSMPKCSAAHAPFGPETHRRSDRPAPHRARRTIPVDRVGHRHQRARGRRRARRGR
jgi:hypothetical protein